MKKNIIIPLSILVLLIIAGLTYFFLIKKEEVKDNVKFAEEYTNVSEDNPFVYRNVDEIINILEKGTGVVYLGFPKCPWCQAYIPYVNEVAKKVGIEKIYYFNILEERKNNTEKYQKIVDILKEYLQNDEEGNKRIYVPALIVVKEGKIVDFDDQTDTNGYDNPTDYWANTDPEPLKAKLEKAFTEVKSTVCKSGCND